MSVFLDSVECQLSVNETQLNHINVTHLVLNAEYELIVVAVNDVGTTASDSIRVLVGMPYAQFGILNLLMTYFTFS